MNVLRAFVASIGFATALLATSAGAQSSITGFQFTSSPTSYQGRGQTVSVSPSSGFLFQMAGTTEHPNQIGANIHDYASNRDPEAARHFHVAFSTPFYAPMAVGTYLDARRLPFAAPQHPGMQFEVDFLGNNELTGWFQVLEIAYGRNGLLSSLAVDFVQYDEGELHRWTFGSFRYNAHVALTPVPEPATSWMLAGGLAALLAAGRRRLLTRRGRVRGA